MRFGYRRFPLTRHFQLALTLRVGTKRVMRIWMEPNLKLRTAFARCAVWLAFGGLYLAMPVFSQTPDAFNPGADASVACLVPYTNDAILAGGVFTILGQPGQPPRFGRLLADGTRDTSFGGGASGAPGLGPLPAVYCLAVQPDGMVVVGGYFVTLAGTNVFSLGRVDDNGYADSTFAPAPSAPPLSEVYSLALQEDGKLLVGGRFQSMAGGSSNNLTRLNSNGTLDTGFTASVVGAVSSIAVQTNGQILVAGSFTMLDGQARTGLGRLNADGSLDAAFNPGVAGWVPGTAGWVNCLAVQPDQRILVGGLFAGLAGVTHGSLARLNADGSFDNSFTAEANDDVYTLALQTDGKILVGGRFTELGGGPASNIGRLTGDGTLDPGFIASTDGEVDCLALQSDGSILLGGSFSMINSASRTNLGRLLNSEPAVENLTFDGTTVVWTRDGASPETLAATFQLSTNGADWLSLGAGTRISNTWQLTGLSLTTNSLIRARGRVVGNGSSWLVETNMLLTEVWAPSIIAVQPANLTTNEGTPAMFSVIAGGTAPLSYQWYKDGGLLDGRTTANLLFPAVAPTDAGSYTVVLTNALGAVTSTPPAVLVVLPPVAPRISGQPESQTSVAGSTVRLAVSVNGSAPFAFQWRKNGTDLADTGNISGARTATLTLSSVGAGDAGSYTVVVSNSVASVTSSPPAVLTVVFPPSIIVPPQSQTVFVGSNANFSVSATGTAPLSYRWLKNGNALANGGNISGATTTNLSLRSVTLSDAGTYTVVVSNSVASAASTPPAILTVVGVPALVVQPPNQAVFAGASVRLSISSAGATPVSYQWLRNGAALTNAGNVSGADAAALTLSDVSLADAGTYSVLVGYLAGSIRSSNATLSVVTPFIPPKGAYNGLFSEAAGVAHERSGFFTLTLAAHGRYTGTLVAGGQRYAGKGQFDSLNPASTAVWRHGTTALTVTIEPSLGTGVEGLVGTISNGTWIADLSADRAVFNARKNPASDYVGTYTLLIPASGSPALPQGDGFGTLKVDSGGRITLAGSLADGTALSQRVPVSKQGRWPLYASLYGGKGSLLGWMTFFPLQSTDDLDGRLTWTRPQTPRTGAYAAGFVIPDIPAVGSVYLPPRGGNKVLNLTAANVVFSGASLPTPLTNGVTLGANNKVAVASPNTNKLTLLLRLPAGSLSGSMSLPRVKKPILYKGVLVQSQNAGFGYFLEEGKSGLVSFGQ